MAEEEKREVNPHAEKRGDAVPAVRRGQGMSGTLGRAEV